MCAKFGCGPMVLSKKKGVQTHNHKRQVCIVDSMITVRQSGMRVMTSYFLLQRCAYCQHIVREHTGACAQCSTGRCTTAFHVTCAHAAGALFEFSDWPIPVYISCLKHCGSHSEVGLSLFLLDCIRSSSSFIL